jgi:hypothetical protein
MMSRKARTCSVERIKWAVGAVSGLIVLLGGVGSAAPVVGEMGGVEDAIMQKGHDGDIMVSMIQIVNV